MNKDEALTLALKALEAAEELAAKHDAELEHGFRCGIIVIKEALASTSTTCEIQPEPKPVTHSNVAYKLAQKELTRLAEENFGRMPNNEWANGVLDLRDHLEAQRTEDTK